MSTQRRNRVPTVPAKRNSASSENAAVGKAVPAPKAAAKKRPPLGNLTNQRRSVVTSSSSYMVKKGSDPSGDSGLMNGKSGDLGVLKRNENSKQVVVVDVDEMDVSITPSPSVSSTDSIKSPDVEYLDENDLGPVSCIQRKTFGDLQIAEQISNSATGSLCKREILGEIELPDDVCNVDEDMEDPQLCATFACDIYSHLRASETKKRPATAYMEKVQLDISASMRSILIDWLVEVADEYRLVPDTLYLTVNYIDRYLSGNSINRERLQLLGITCMMIAAKYEEICAPQVEEFCFISDNTYFKEEVLQMETTVLHFLKFEMTASTTKCFLRRFVRAAQASNEASPLQLECLANYIAELSLLEYQMLEYLPSTIAASAIFLARYILAPSKRPWNSTLQHYTLYQPLHLQDCVRTLHKICLSIGNNPSLPAIREKYSQHKYKFVAKKYCPPTIPSEFF